MPRTKQIVLNCAIFISALFVGFLIVETCLRLLPRSITAVSAGMSYIKDQHIGYRLEPNSNNSSASECFETKVKVNSRGFRGDEWSQNGGIAILGDSYMEGVQVSDNEVLSSQLKDIFDVPVYNAGLSSFGTIAELLTFEAYVKEFKPKIVVLSMFENDILDNHCDISYVNGILVSKPCATIKQNTLEINTNYYSNHGNTALRTFIKKHCVTCNVLRQFVTQIRNIKRKRTEVGDNFIKTQIDDEAWKITRIALERLKASVKTDGGRLVIMVIPDQTAYYQDSVVGDLTSTKIAFLAKEIDIPVLDLYSPMKEYTDKHELREPFFSYSCDGHWNPLGHYIASHLLAKFLIESDSVIRLDRVQLLENLSEKLKQSPEQILGSEVYEGLYK